MYRVEGVIITDSCTTPPLLGLATSAIVPFKIMFRIYFLYK